MLPPSVSCHTQISMSGAGPLFNPLATVARDYELAVLRLIWDVHRKNKQRTLLCGAVELLPIEVPPPLVGGERCTRIGSEHFLYACENVVPVDKALAWFRQATNGRLIRPGGNGKVDDDTPDSPLFAASVFDEEPRGPLLATASKRVPFSAPWEAGARVRHLIPRSFRIEQVWSASEIDDAVAWLKEDVPFDFGEFPEFWGSIHLIAPNPVFRRLYGRLERTDGQTALIIAVDLRRGQSVQGLHFELECKGATGTLYVLRHKLQRVIERLILPGPPEEMYERVHDEHRGLLCERNSFMFASEASAQITMELASEERHVASALPDGTPANYSVPLLGGLSQTFTVGKPATGREAIARLRSGRNERDRRDRGRQDQRWFRDQVADAVAELRRMVSGARQLLWVADPYFGGDDLVRVLLAVRDPKVPIQAMTGAEHLRKYAENLERQMQEAAASPRMNPLAVRVMQGASPPLHDRFLLIDDDLWMLGSSLNSLGDRGSLLVRVPDPAPVLADLRTIWDEAEEFSVWFKRRREARQS